MRRYRGTHVMGAHVRGCTCEGTHGGVVLLK